MLPVTKMEANKVHIRQRMQFQCLSVGIVPSSKTPVDLIPECAAKMLQCSCKIVPMAALGKLYSSLSRCSSLVKTTCLLVSSISPARKTSSRIAYTWSLSASLC